MKAIQELRSEHESIATILERFERWIDQAEQDFEVDREVIGRLLDFFEQSVDGQHQEKEERVFLPCLMRRVTGQSAHVHKLFREHLEDRKLLAMMRNNLEGACFGEPNCIRVLVRHGRLYLAHEHKHARWEETLLFELAERILTPEDDREIAQGFRHIDKLWDSTVGIAARRLCCWLDQRGATVRC